MLMKARPILFTAEMVRATLDGRKTQMRRIVKPQPIPFGKSSYGGSRQGYSCKSDSLNRSWNDDDKDPYQNESLATAALGCECPYGQPGDHLWVRETFRANGTFGINGRIQYRADGDYGSVLPWKPSIFMPRKASRITLKIIAVRVERLNEISGADAKSEGCNSTSICISGKSAAIMDRKYNFQTGDYPTTDAMAIGNFRGLWESINGVDSWKQNPLVWVMEFKKL